MKLVARFALVLFVFFTVIFSNAAFAIDVVYPKRNNTTIWAKSTYFVGNIGNDTTLTINNEPVEIFKRGVFVTVVPLQYGENTFVLTATSSHGKKTSVTYKFNRPEPKPRAQQPTQKKAEPEIFADKIYGEVIKSHIPLRARSSDSSDRVTHLNKGTLLVLDAKFNNFYRVYINEGNYFWIKKDFVKEIKPQGIIEFGNLESFKYSYDKRYEYFELKTQNSRPFKIDEKPEGLRVYLYNVLNIPTGLDEYVDDIKLENKVLSFFIPQSKMWGYDCYHEEGKLLIRLTRAVNVDSHRPLDGLTIAVDAGHGGTEAGAIGPTRVREADIVIDIAKRLKKLLLQEGAKVVMTREDNSNLGVYERVDIAKSHNALFLLSIHANALPDGADPYKRYGTGVYYYYPQAKELADTIKQYMVGMLNTNDDGTRCASLALNRVTSPMAVLIETAYMINPFDYENLLDENFRQKIAESIVLGLKSYMRASVPK